MFKATQLSMSRLQDTLLAEEVSKDCTSVTACVWENTGQREAGNNPKKQDLKLALFYPQAYHTIKNTFTPEYTTWQLGQNCKLNVFYCHKNQEYT